MSAIAQTVAPESTSMPAEHFNKVRDWLAAQLAPMAGDRMGLAPDNVAWASGQIQKLLAQNNIRLANGDAAQLTDVVVDEIVGYGPIGPYLRDPTVSEV